MKFSLWIPVEFAVKCIAHLFGIEINEIHHYLELLHLTYLYRTFSFKGLLKPDITFYLYKIRRFEERGKTDLLVSGYSGKLKEQKKT